MKTICPACDAVFSLPAALPGAAVHCPKCGHRIAPATRLGVSGDVPPPDRIATGLSLLTACCWLVIFLVLAGAGALHNEGRTTEAVAVACGVIPLALWWAGVSLVVNCLGQIERNTRQKSVR
jgi:DNA-directed RNA polymerase subunit RPC12/RpoP